jgi:flagellum-specific ATP synthase
MMTARVDTRTVPADLAPRVWAVDRALRIGRVSRVRGGELEVRGLRLPVGGMVTVKVDGAQTAGQVVGVGPTSVVVALFANTDGVQRGDEVVAIPQLVPRAGEALLGRVVDGLGRPLDGGPPIVGVPLEGGVMAQNPLLRERVGSSLETGVRALDLLVPVAKGQRLGIFGGSGVGKSTLLGMMARGTNAALNVVALIGERGREVRELIEDDLGVEGLARSVVVVATSDQPAIMRRRAGELAVRYAEHFADAGSDVLLLFDSLTRLSMAQRELGLAAGEPPTARGYTPSVFSLLPSLLERTGPRASGSITGFFTVLVDGDDMNDPIADAARSILDGHVILERRLAHQGRYPAIDPLASLSRLASAVCSPEDLQAASLIRSALASVEEVRDLVEVGAYAHGSNPSADAGLAMHPEILALLTQSPADLTPAENTWLVARDIAARMS